LNHENNLKKHNEFLITTSKKIKYEIINVKNIFIIDIKFTPFVPKNLPNIDINKKFIKGKYKTKRYIKKYKNLTFY